MPPKPKFTRQQIIQTALQIVSRRGLPALTANELGNALGSSARPIFTVFTSMKEVQAGVRQAAMARFEDYAHRVEADMPAFRQVGMQMIRFALEEPQLFRLVFMTENSGVTPFGDHYAGLGDVADRCLDAIVAEYGLPRADAQLLFEHVWIHTFGIGALCATGACRFTMEEISRMLTQDFTAMMTLLRRGK